MGNRETLGIKMLRKEYDHIILLAHGSPDPLWKQPFESLYHQVSQTYGEGNVSLAYMELTSPSLEDVIATLGKEVRQIGVLPLFLAVGRHLRQDVPEQIAALQTDGLDIKLLPPIGDDERIKQAMQAVIANHLGKV
ncbi:cobalamin biosynthesis protein CbiX [Marinomonas sp. M1K-6]|uniref:Cobalamin biosynthesis protein CbiX n=1 Tax=Marinomonas profundi TaxID=2726122 RepID=A0A847QZF6_9GAMM|nr:CbiX/SirB N-terminal domain-containing protein [Marinomonas profundi]NLQ16391.1 cobalamin biosynthesis protein CbiX [Marinomonas profundi]UDV03036.1 CbiX/SirB N-terminal domain-containing protein [Marinomonas profundi]